MADGKNMDFLGRGWSFPPTFDLAKQELVMTERETDIERSLHILLTTALGERVMQPKYGCDMEEYLFESMNRTTQSLVIDRIRTAILFFEPRIDVDRIHLGQSEENEGKMLVTIEFSVRATNSRLNFVFPFYVKEGTELGFLTEAPLRHG
ncbi:MAG TPA: GPW/gp25 family protein [Polyangiaceae bacterium]|nr:GPW/gp25 family protein [Polyangiaceae bacterium]